MLLPSDIARLVLGYLQQEGLSATSQAFILESPNLKEYAEHSTEDGAIPACVFSLFGKNLTTILNEYVAAKAKETSQEPQIPAMMTSLWKKLEFTLNQIKCMQNSPAVHQNQRLRTRNGIMNLRRQRALSPPRIPSNPTTSGHYVPSPISAPQSMLGHTPAVCYSPLPTRPSPICPPQVQDGSRLVISMNRDSPLQVVVPDHRINPGPLSPARRKCDSPRRRGGGGGCGGPGRAILPANIPTVEVQPESHQETVGENFPQMVIENAREKILNDKSLQEKLAENINKILGSEITPQTSKQTACNSMEQDQSIDEILGLQGEIHMTDDAIQDILEQTESDPAFQALFDLFDYGKDKNDADHQGDVNTSTTSLQSNEAEQNDRFPVMGDQGASPEDSASGAEAPRKPRTRKAQELKSKKCRKTKPRLPSTSRTVPALNPPRPLSDGRLDTRAPTQTKAASAEGKTLVCNDRPTRTSQSPQQGGDLKDTNSTVVEKDSEIPPPLEEDADVVVRRLSSATSHERAEHFILQPEMPQSLQPSEDSGGRSPGTSVCETDISKAAAVNPAEKRCECSPGLEEAEGSVLGFSIEDPLIGSTMEPADQPNPEGSLALSINAADSQTVRNQNAGLAQKSPTSLGLGTRDSEEAAHECHPNPEDSSLSTPEAAPPLFSTPAALSTAREADASKIMSLKIIISDEQEEQSGDSTLSQVVSSITGERLPTIILSSPAKSPAKAPTGMASSVTAEETVQAVSCLQSSELTCQLTEPGTGMEESVQLSISGELVPEGSFIQLLPSTPSYGGSSNYFIVTDPAMVGHQSGMVVLPGSTPLGQIASPPHVLATPPRARPVSMAPDGSKAYPSGSTLIISSPVQPMLQSMMVPASAVGPKNAGTFTIVSNQLVTLPVTSGKVTTSSKSKPKLAPKDMASSGNTGPLGSSGFPLRPAIPQPSSQDPRQLTLLDGVAMGTGPGSSPASHRRMLCFNTDSLSSADTAVPPRNPPSPTLATQVAIPQPPTTASSPIPTVGTLSPSKKSIKESPCSQGVRGPKFRSVQPAILRGSRTARAESSRYPEDVKTPEPSGDTKKQCNHTAKAQSTSVRTEPLPPEAAGRSGVARKQQIVDKREFPVTGATKDMAENGGPPAAEHRVKSKPMGTKKEDQRSRTEVGEKPQARGKEGREGRVERRGSSLEPPHVTANKENELEGSRREHHPVAATPPGESGPPAIGSPVPPSQSKTNPLTKQAAEMLHDIQGLNPVSTPSKRLGLGCSELPHPRTPGLVGPTEEPSECLRTPIRQRHGRDREGTPRHLVATPDVPTCSPASEAGSESSINMAAQTLISLSRAGRAGTPLKDSVLRQGAASAAVNNIATVAPKTKKRKQSESHAGSLAKKELQLSGSAASKKAAKKRKRLLESFPDDLDVDKFLSSLHYDE